MVRKYFACFVRCRNIDNFCPPSISSLAPSLDRPCDLLRGPRKNYPGYQTLSERKFSFSESLVPRVRKNVIEPSNFIKSSAPFLNFGVSSKKPAGGVIAPWPHQPGRHSLSLQSQKLAKIVKEKWHKVSWVYLQIKAQAMVVGSQHKIKKIID